MIGANAAALEENGRRLSEGRGVYDEVKGLEVRVAQSKEAYAMYDENLSVMSQVSYLLSGLFPIFFWYALWAWRVWNRRVSTKKMPL